MVRGWNNSCSLLDSVDSAVLSSNSGGSGAAESAFRLVEMLDLWF